MPRYRLCGFTFDTEWPLVTRLLPSTDRPDLTFRVVDEAPVEGTWTRGDVGGDEDETIALGSVGATDVLRVPGIGDAWFVSEDEVVFHLTHPENDFQVEVLLLGVLAAYWLERRGQTALHASAVAGDGWSVGIMGPNRTGKTSLALELLGRGHRFLTDDLLAVSVDTEAWAFPSFPQARLWPEEAERLLGSTSGLQQAHPYFEKLRVPVDDHRMADEPAPLTALYVRNSRQSPDGAIEKVPGARALFHLIFNSFAFDLLDIPASRRAWLARLGRLLEVVAVYSLPGRVSTEDEASMVAEHAAGLAARSGRSG